MESTQPILRCRYSYDPLDRLISQLQPDAPAHQRFYCKSRLATEIQGAIGFSVFQNNDLLLAQHKNQGGAVESTLLATDQQRSVLHTFTADQQQHPIAYSPYGHRQAESGLTSLLGFNGERPDPVTGHYLLGNGYRAFNPVLMRFNSPDSLSPFEKGGVNTYAYCLGDPINKIDPSGNIPLSIKMANRALSWASKARSNLAQSSGSALSGRLSPANLSGPVTRIEYRFLGYHGTARTHISSLKNGLDKQTAGKYGNETLGSGFYTSTSFEHARNNAFHAASKENSSPVVVKVYIKHTHNVKPKQHSRPNDIAPPSKSNSPKIIQNGPTNLVPFDLYDQVKIQIFENPAWVADPSIPGRRIPKENAYIRK